MYTTLAQSDLKFGKFIQKRQLEIPEYAAKFVDYKALKKLIKKLSATPILQAQPSEALGGSQTEPQASLQANKATFFFRLERELEKVNGFYEQKEDELKHRLRTLLERKRALEQRQRSGSKLGSVYRTLDEGFRVFNSDLDKLQQFVEINQTAFSKILKKWDKTSKSRTKELYLSRAVEVQPIFNRDIISDLSDKATTSLLDLADWAEGNNVVFRATAIDQSSPPLGNAALDEGDLDSAVQNALIAGNVAYVLDWYENTSQDPNRSRRISRVFLTTINQAPLAAQKTILEACQVDIDFADDINERTSLHELAISGRLDSLLLVLSFGADVRTTDGYGRTPLHYACMNGKVAVVEPLHAADVQLLSQINANTADQTSPGIAISIIDLVDLDNFTPLVHGIMHSHYDVVAALLALGARVNPSGDNDHIPLNLACQDGSVPIVELLLRYHPQLLADAEGLYPQHLVPRSGKSPQLLLILKDYGADLDQPDKLYQWTPLFHAASEGHLQCVQTLLQCGANPNVLDEKGLPAMYYAAWEGRLDCLKLLESATSQILAKTSPTMTAVKETLAAPQSVPISAKGEPESIPDLSLPPPIIPLRRYGHNFLDTTKTFVVISFDTTGPGAIFFYGNNKYPAARLTISSRSSDLIPRNITLPIQEESRNIAFQIQDLETFSIDFDIYPTFGSKVIARAAASSTVFSSRSHSTGSWMLELFDPRLKNIGRMAFRYQVVTPFKGVPVEVTQFATYWKATSQLGSQPSALITGSSLSGDYLRVFVQTTRDGIPVLYPGWGIPSALARFGVLNDLISRLTFEQLAAIVSESGQASPADIIASIPAHEHRALAEKLAASCASLQDVLIALAPHVHIDVHIIYPTRKQEEELRLGPTANLNAVVDSILGVVFENAGRLRQGPDGAVRSVVFSSYNPDVCTALNWKQPNYPVLLCNDLGAEAPSDSSRPASDSVHSDGRTAISVKEAVRVAQSNNFMGLVCSARLLALVPALSEAIKVAGLVLITDVADASQRPSAPVSSFHGIPETVDGMLEGNAVLRFKESVDV